VGDTGQSVLADARLGFGGEGHPISA